VLVRSTLLNAVVRFCRVDWSTRRALDGQESGTQARLLDKRSRAVKPPAGSTAFGVEVSFVEDPRGVDPVNLLA
jgi:hypothetical protein